MVDKELFTIGTSDRPADEFIELLKENGITLVIDVRSKTGSRTLHFDEKRFGNLSKLLEKNGITYDQSLHLVLGGLQNGKMTLGNFRNYTNTPEFKDGIKQLKEKMNNNQGKTAIMCCERNIKQCHRRIIAKELYDEFYTIHHL